MSSVLSVDKDLSSTERRVAQEILDALFDDSKVKVALPNRARGWLTWWKEHAVEARIVDPVQANRFLIRAVGGCFNMIVRLADELEKAKRQ